MKNIITILIGSIVAAAVVTSGLLLMPFLLQDRLTHPVTVNSVRMFGLTASEVVSQLQGAAPAFGSQAITIEFRGKTFKTRLVEAGVSINIPATTQKVLSTRVMWPWQPQTVTPELIIDHVKFVRRVNQLFASELKLPQNASLTVSANGTTRRIRSQAGEQPDSAALSHDVNQYLAEATPKPLKLQILPAEADVQDNEVERAQALTEKILADGFALKFEDKTFAMSRSELIPLLEFVEQIDPQDPTNLILGVRLEPEKLRAYLTKRIVPEVDQSPVDAKFEINTSENGEVRVNAFAAPQRGLILNVDPSAENIARAFMSGVPAAQLSVASVEPAVTENADLVTLGITNLLAHGESNFAGSPRNRIHNITVGTSRYHGLLIAPGEEFSFNDHLGPVTAEAGFKPELVIKEHTTVPELGGGLCQVSTTAFRAAIYAGLEITQRRNHAYAVRYYGTPGFDSTIYPGYTDLRFRNNTPGHILVQTKIEGTKLSFDFWGTSDGRIVEVEGPYPYNRQPDGAVKATLTQRVLKDGQTVFEKAFNSNYKSPNLFPHVVAANGEQNANPTPASTAAPAPTAGGPSPGPSQAKTPASPAAPAI